eukprot:3123303-Lingulodinium_polyedra.AAC.1
MLHSATHGSGSRCLAGRSLRHPLRARQLRGSAREPVRESRASKCRIPASSLLASSGPAPELYFASRKTTSAASSSSAVVQSFFSELHQRRNSVTRAA